MALPRSEGEADRPEGEPSSVVRVLAEGLATSETLSNLTIVLRSVDDESLENAFGAMPRLWRAYCERCGVGARRLAGMREGSGNSQPDEADAHEALGRLLEEGVDRRRDGGTRARRFHALAAVLGGEWLRNVIAAWRVGSSESSGPSSASLGQLDRVDVHVALARALASGSPERPTAHRRVANLVLLARAGLVGDAAFCQRIVAAAAAVLEGQAPCDGAPSDDARSLLAFLACGTCP